METAPAQHSSDGSWWWSGSEWLPARSADGRYWFDGASWRRSRGVGRNVTGFEKRLGAVWVAWFIVACAWAGFAGPHVVPDLGLTGGWLASGAVVLALWLLGMVATGYLLTARRRARSLLAFVPFGWALMGFWVAVLAAAPVPGTTDDDNGPAVGLVLLAVPAFAVLALLAGVGFAAAWLVTRTGARRSER